MAGHGHVTPNADGSKARCGGPMICSVCARETSALSEEGLDHIILLQCTIGEQADEIKALTAELERKQSERDYWVEEARRYAENADYYRGLVVQIGKRFGIAARTSDDGSIQDDVLCAKVAVLAIQAQAEVTTLRQVCQLAKVALEHSVPGDCWSTGPLTGVDMECIGCWAMGAIDKALAALDGDSERHA